LGLSQEQLPLIDTELKGLMNGGQPPIIRPSFFAWRRVALARVAFRRTDAMAPGRVGTPQT